MERGTYVAASGGLLQLRKLDVVSNNLANVNTPGFKRQLLVSTEQPFEATLASQMVKDDPYARGDHERTPGTMNIQTITDFSAGPIKTTGNPLDVALRDPRDFFVVNTIDGPQLTRAGNFTLSQEGELITQDGFAVQGDGGSIAVNGAAAKITESGRVFSGGVDAGGLQVVRVQKPEELTRMGNNLFKPGNGEAPQQVEAELVPESLEMANVSAISSVIDLITTHRAFDLYTRSAQTIDQMNQTAINQVGRPRG